MRGSGGSEERSPMNRIPSTAAGLRAATGAFVACLIFCGADASAPLRFAATEMSRPDPCMQFIKETSAWPATRCWDECDEHKLVYNSADSLLCQCYNSNVLLMRIERRTMASIQVRVDDALRDEAVAVLNRLGMDMATAVRLLLNQIVVDNGYPFKPTSDPFYSSSNIRHLEKVLDDVKHKRNLVSHPLVEMD